MVVSTAVSRGGGTGTGTGRRRTSVSPKRWFIMIMMMMMMTGAMIVVVAWLTTSNLFVMMKCYSHDNFGAVPNRELHPNVVVSNSPRLHSLSKSSSSSSSSSSIGTTLGTTLGTIKHDNNDNNNDNNDSDNTTMSESTGKFVIFYNAFVNPDWVNKSVDIMKEQMLQVYTSSHWNTTVYYNILGYNLTSNTNDAHRFCHADMDCRFHRYIPEGDEVETIADLYHYCTQHPLDSVVYLHDKGSYNYVGRNHWIRRVGSKSALSDACRYTMTELDCNVCLMKFHYLPNPHTQGNFWTAQCSYIKTLIPPKEYETRRREMMMDLFYNQKKVLSNLGCFYILLEEVMRTIKQNTKAKAATSTTNHPLYDGMYAKHLSLGRYAMESWIMSAPWSRPCHTMSGQVRSYNRHTWIPVVQKGVGPSPIHYFNETSTGWFLSYGRLYEYQTLYNNTVPPRDSWFYEKIPFKTITAENAMNCTPMPPFKEPKRQQQQQQQQPKS